MAKVISRDSIQRANESLSRGSSRGISMDSNNVSTNVHTSFGSYQMTFSRSEIVKAASVTMKEFSK
ncbi:MAG: hypothetical protein J6B46_05495 [Parabacteroides sp.]|nr:hypothetical protein [Bacteroidaceae bacterium]MBO5225843.1 hypothetical protein [Parabacteroides sp.]